MIEADADSDKYGKIQELALHGTANIRILTLTCSLVVAAIGRTSGVQF